jgi:hypothetical protein
MSNVYGDKVNSYEGGVGKAIVQGMRINKTAAQTVLGTIRNLAGGRQIVYAGIGAAAVSACTMLQAIAPVANHQACSVVGTASVGATQVTITLGATSASADQYKDGFLAVISGTGAGYSYMIEYHNAAAASGNINVKLKDGLEAAVVSTTVTSLIANKYAGCLKNPAPATAKAVGVALCTGAASSFGWLGKKGPFMCLASGDAITNGTQVGLYSATGTVGQFASALETTQVVGVACQSAAAGAARCMVDLDL